MNRIDAHTHGFATPETKRGILCRPCNSILGLAREDAECLRALALYIDPRFHLSRALVADIETYRRWQ